MMKRLLVILLTLVSLQSYSQSEYNNERMFVLASTDISVMWGVRANVGLGFKTGKFQYTMYGNTSFFENHKEVGVRLGYEMLKTDWLSLMAEGHANRQYYVSVDKVRRSSYHGRLGIAGYQNNSDVFNFYWGIYLDNILPYIEIGGKINLSK